jgi:hypothetical protein
MLRYALLMLLSCPCFTAVAAGMPLGPLFLTLGSDQDSVMKQVHSRFHVIPVSGSPDTFFLSEERPPKVNVIGGVAFKNSRLTWVQRNWGVFTGRVTSTQVTDAIHSALESASMAGQSASVSVTTQRIPGTEFKVMTFSVPGRKVVVTTSETQSPPRSHQLSVEESISEQ